VPIWAKQVESSRSQTEQAIVALSNRFSGIYTAGRNRDSQLAARPQAT
jgi:hypothetical protein